MMVCDLCGKAGKYPPNAWRMARDQLGVEDLCADCEVRFNKELDAFMTQEAKGREERFKRWLHNIKFDLSGSYL